jgi:hypothetical protein
MKTGCMRKQAEINADQWTDQVIQQARERGPVPKKKGVLH